MKTIKKFILTIGILSFLIILLSPAPENLSSSGKNALAVFILCVSFWITNAIPLSITGLIAIVSIPVFKIMDSKTTFSYFGNSAVFFILGAFILSTAMMKTGLSKRLAILFLKQFDRNADMLSFGILVTSFFLTFWMPEHVVAALLFPIILEIAKNLKLKPQQSNLGKKLFLSMAWGTVIGGVSTFLGGARNPLAIEMLKETYNLDISFLEWMIAVIPVASVLLGITYLLLRLLFRTEAVSINEARKTLMDSVKDMGKLSSDEKKVAIIAALTIFAWIFLNKYIEIANIALLSAISLFIFRAVKWKDIEHYINWGIILMYGGAVTLGATLAEVGAMDWVAQQIFTCVSLTPFSSVVMLSIISKVLTELISNVASVATLIPLGFGIADSVGMNPTLIVYVIAVQSGLAFCLPIGTPPNAIAFSAGYYRISDVIKGGILLNMFALLIFLICVKSYWNIIGIQFH